MYVLHFLYFCTRMHKIAFACWLLRLEQQQVAMDVPPAVHLLTCSRGRTAGSYDRTSFGFLKALHMFLFMVNVYLPSSVNRFPSLHSLTNVCVSIFLVISILTRVRHLIVVYFSLFLRTFDGYIFHVFVGQFYLFS